MLQLVPYIDQIRNTAHFKPIKKIRIFQKEGLTEIFKEIDDSLKEKRKRG